MASSAPNLRSRADEVVSLGSMRATAEQDFAQLEEEISSCDETPQNGSNSGQQRHPEQEAGVETAQAGRSTEQVPFVPREVIEPLKNGQLIVKTEALTDEIRAALLSNKDIYPDQLQAVYNDFRCHDRPSEEVFAAPVVADSDTTVSKAQPNPSAPSGTQPKNARAKGRFNRLKYEQTASPSNIAVNKLTKRQAFVTVLITARDGSRQYFNQGITMTPVMDTQCPGLNLRVKRENAPDGSSQPDAQIQIWPNSIKRSTKTCEFAVRHSHGEGNPEPMYALAREAGIVRGNKDTDGLLAIAIGLHNLENFKYGEGAPVGALPCRPTFKGNLKLEVQGFLKTIDDMGWRRGDQDAFLSDADWAMIYLHEAVSITIFRPWPNTEAHLVAIHNFRQYWERAMEDAIMHGNFPYYRRHALIQNQDIESRLFDLAKVPPPVHLVQKWRLTYKDGVLQDVVPEQWVGFIDAESSYPDPQTTSLALRIGVERIRRYERAVLYDTFGGRDDIAMTGTFHQLIGDTSCYWVEVNVADTFDMTTLSKYRRSAPEINTRVSIEIIEKDGVNARFAGSVFNGVVSQDIQLRKPVFAAMVWQGINTVKLPDGEYRIAVELKSDPTPAQRQNAALIELGKGLERKVGVDLPHFVLGCIPTVENPGLLCDEIMNNDQAKKMFEDLIKMFKLNEKQAAAAQSVFYSTVGMHHLWGPPGTGKTYTLMDSIVANVLVGKVEKVQRRRVMFCGPTNTTVTDACKRLNDTGALARCNIEVVIFTGAFVRRPRRDNEMSRVAVGEVEDFDRTEEEERWDQIESLARASDTDKSIWAFYLHNRVEAFAKALRKDPQSKYYDLADYHKQQLILSRESPDANLRKQAKAEYRNAKDGLMRIYLEEIVDVVFCTNSSAAHPTLLDSWHPRVCILDEAAFSSLADTAVPLAAYKEDIMLTLLAGDDKQQDPPVMSRGANECLRPLQNTLFTQLKIGNVLSDAEKTMLTIQHRMRPYLSRPVSMIHYGGALQDHESLLDETDLMKQVAKALKPLGPFLGPTDNDKRENYKSLRFAVDVAGYRWSESRIEGSSSVCNTHEALAIAKYVEFLLLNNISPEDILCLSPYSLQCGRIRTELDNIGRETRAVKVVSSARVQGDEAKIVLLSMVRNTPEKPDRVGFTGNSKQLCVNFSRAMEHFVVFGNFVEISQAIHRGHPKLDVRKRGGLGDLSRWIQDFADQGEIISYSHFEALLQRKPLDPQDDARLKLRVVRENRLVERPDYLTDILGRERKYPGTFKAAENAARGSSAKRRIATLAVDKDGDSGMTTGDPASPVAAQPLARAPAVGLGAWPALPVLRDPAPQSAPPPAPKVVLPRTLAPPAGTPVPSSSGPSAGPASSGTARPYGAPDPAPHGASAPRPDAASLAPVDRMQQIRQQNWRGQDRGGGRARGAGSARGARGDRR